MTPHSPTLSSLHLRHSSFSNPSVTSPASQLILQPFRSFTKITAHSRTLPSLHRHHSSLYNPSVASPTSQLILQPFRRFTYVTAHFQTIPSHHLRHSPFSNPFVASSTSQLIFKPFHRFIHVTAHSPTLLSPLLRHRIFTYVTWRAAHAIKMYCIRRHLYFCVNFVNYYIQGLRMLHINTPLWFLTLELKKARHWSLSWARYIHSPASQYSFLNPFEYYPPICLSTSL